MVVERSQLLRCRSRVGLVSSEAGKLNARILAAREKEEASRLEQVQLSSLVIQCVIDCRLGFTFLQYNNNRLNLKKHNEIANRSCMILEIDSISLSKLPDLRHKSPVISLICTTKHTHKQ